MESKKYKGKLMWEVEKRGSVNEEENKSNMIVIFFFFSCEINKHHFLAKQNAQNHVVLKLFVFIN